VLIDPYVELSPWVRNQLLEFSGKTLPSLLNMDPDNFLTCYKYCSITRNLQILGAFAYLGRIKGKRYFEKYIPNAIKTLKYNLSDLENTEFADLKSVVEKI
jgi:aminoglycoside/choline kinase family phosphotransferase